MSNNISEPQCAGVAKLSQLKHLEIHEAINEMDGVIYNITDLINRVMGGDGAPTGDEARPQPSLEILLDNGATRIRDNNVRIAELVRELENKLF